jgi:hypothetical protein
MNPEDREVFRALAGQIDAMVGGVNGPVGGVNRLVDGVRLMGETLAGQAQAVTGELRALTSELRGMREDMGREIRETRIVLRESQEAPADGRGRARQRGGAWLLPGPGFRRGRRAATGGGRPCARPRGLSPYGLTERRTA